MTDPDETPPLGRIRELLGQKFGPNAEFDVVIEQMRALDLTVHQYMAQTLTPYVNKHLATAPQNSESDRRTLADSVSSALRHLGIAFRFKDTDRPAYLHLVHAATKPYSVNGDYLMELLDRSDGHQRQTCSLGITDASFYPVSLMPIPDQYGLWSDRLHARNRNSEPREGKNRGGKK